MISYARPTLKKMDLIDDNDDYPKRAIRVFHLMQIMKCLRIFMMVHVCLVIYGEKFQFHLYPKIKRSQSFQPFEWCYPVF